MAAAGFLGDQLPASGLALQWPPGCTEIVPVLPGFVGSGKVIVGRPFTTSPSTSIDVAPNSWVPPSQVMERVGTDFLPPQAASDSRISNKLVDS